MTDASPATRVVIVDDHAMFRAGVRPSSPSAGAGVVDIVAEAADVDSAVAAIARAPAPTSYCSTCTCPAVAASR